MTKSQDFWGPEHRQGIQVWGIPWGEIKINVKLAQAAWAF